MAGLLFNGERWQVLAFWCVIIGAQNRSAYVTAYGITDITASPDLDFPSIVWKYQIISISLAHRHPNKKISSQELQILW